MKQKRRQIIISAGLILTILTGCNNNGSPSGFTGNSSGNSTSLSEAVSEPVGSNEDLYGSSVVSESVSDTGTENSYHSSVVSAVSKNTNSKSTSTATTPVPTVKATVKGHISKSDNSIEPVRSLKEIMSNLSSADLSCDSYNIDKYLLPYWKGNIIYNESLNFIKDGKTGIASAPLLYDAVKILSVKNSSLDITYKEGVDYTYANGKITLTANSNIHKFEYNEIFFDQEKPGNSWLRKNGKYTYFAEGTFFHSNQIAVTYLHSEPWTGYKPAYQGGMIPNTIKKLKNGEKISIVFLGDSITKGGNASGMFNIAPKMPIWTDMVITSLKNAYPKSSITSFNASNNGATSSQAMKNLRELCSDHNPDLVIIGFGMNDGSDSNFTAPAFQKNIDALMQTNDFLIKKECDYILLSTTLPNQDIVLGNANLQDQYAEVLFQLERTGVVNGKTGQGGVVVGDMTAIHKILLKSKRFFDMTANNVNHPNDFLVRSYAQTVCTMLIENFK